MKKEEAIKLFEEIQVRTHWNNDAEKWYFSIVDTIQILTDSVDASAYMRKLKQRLKAGGNQTMTNLHGLKFKQRARLLINEIMARKETVAD